MTTTGAPRMGFDVSAYPGAAAMQQLFESTNLEYCGFYLAPTACSGRQDKSWMDGDSGQPGTTVDTLRGIGWGLLPVYVGRQTSEITTVPAAARKDLDYDHGASEADDAVSLARAAGLEPGSVIYLDIETGTLDLADATSESAQQMEYVKGWLDKIEASDYAGGVYCHTNWADRISADRPEVHLWVVKTTPHSVPRFDSGHPQNVVTPTGGAAGCGVDTALTWQYVLDWSGTWNFTDPDGQSGSVSNIDFDVSTVGDPSRPDADVWAIRNAVDSIVVDPTAASAGDSVQVTVSLKDAACWPNGAYVAFTSSRPDILAVPGLRIPVGDQSATTSAQVGPGNVAGDITITAACNGQPLPAEATLQVDDPGPQPLVRTFVRTATPDDRLPAVGRNRVVAPSARTTGSPAMARPRSTSPLVVRNGSVAVLPQRLAPPDVAQFIAPAPLVVTSASARSVTIPYFNGLDYAVGVDTPSGSPLNVAVTGDITQIPVARGQIYDYYMNTLTSEEDLQTALGVSATASGGTGLFKASAEFNFSQSCELNSSYAFAVVRIMVTNAFSQIKQPGITTDAAALLANGDNTGFQRQFGDMFVRGISMGGVFVGVIQVSTTSETDKQDLLAKLSVAYGPFKASGTFTDDFKQTLSQRSMSAKIHAVGGDLPPQLITNMDQLVATAGGWPATVAAKPWPFTALLNDYGILPVPNPPSYIDLEHQRDVLTQCAAWRNLDLTTTRDILFIKSNPTQFIGPDIAQLDQLQNNINDDLTTISHAASHALSNPVDAQLPKLLQTPPAPLPQRVTAPMVTGVAPATGRAVGGDTVTLTGTGFTGTTAVLFGAVAATNVVVLSDTMLTASSPAQTTAGTVDVTVTTPAGTSATSAADDYTYTWVLPVVTGIGPATGPTQGGNTVTITGTGFTGTTRVNFGPATAVNLTMLSDTMLTVSTPARLTAGTVDVTVTTPAGTSATSAADDYTYTWVIPVVTGIGPTTGPTQAGNTVTITGTGFTGATRVNFGPATAADLTVRDDTRITVTSPAQTTPGTVDVTVTTPAGTSATSASDDYTYVAPLTVITTSLPAAVCGSLYTQGQLQASGGLGPVTWGLASGSLPWGLSLTPDGRVVGAPSISQPDPPSFIVRATDRAGTVANSRSLSIYLVGRQVFFTNAAHPVDQDASSTHPVDITKTYTFQAPTGSVILTPTVNIDPVPDSTRGANAPWRVFNEIKSQNVVQFDVFTGAAGFGHHSGHVVVTVSFTYQTV